MDNDQRNEGPGFQPIGNHLPSILPSPNGKASAAPKLRTSETGSATTGSGRRAKPESSATGLQRGATRSEVRPRSVAETDAALIHSLPHSVRSCLATKESGRFTEDGRFLGVTKTYSLAADPAALDEARETVEGAMAPMERDELVKCLGQLRALTAAKNTGETDLKLVLSAFASRLTRWPADVVREVLESQSSISKWWPAWAEVEERLVELAAPREALLATLQPRKRYSRTYLGHGAWRD